MPLSSRARREVARRRRLQCEALEHRNLLATYIVQFNPTSGTGGDGSPQNPFASVGEAVAVARLNPGGDEIQIRPGTYPESVLINDTDDLKIVGDATQRPIVRDLTIRTPNANFIIENLNIASNTAIGVYVDNLPGPNSVIPSRTGAVTLSNMDIAMAQVNGNAGVLVNGLNQFVASNIKSTSGRIGLNDVNTATLSQINVVGARANALLANYVTNLTVNGLTALQPAGTGVVLANPIRTNPGAVNASATASLSGVQISNSGSSGLDASGIISLSVRDSSFNVNTAQGLLLSGLISVDLTNVVAGRNANGISLNSGSSNQRTAFTARNMTADFNRSSGMLATNSGSITITGGSFSNNLSSGILTDTTTGSIRLTDIEANSNTVSGLSLRNMTSDVVLTRVTTNDNKSGNGVSISAFNSPTAPQIIVSAGNSLRNRQLGMALTGVGAISIDGLIANDNGGLGLQVAQTTGTVTVVNSQFDRNSKAASQFATAFSGAIFSTLKSGLTLTNVTANENALDGLIIDNAIGPVVASGITAGGNPLTGLYVNNATLSQQATLTLTNSSLSGNGRNGLLADRQSQVSIARSNFDNNGPAENVNTDTATGVWIASPGAGGVTIEDSTAIGTRLGTQRGAGIQIVTALSPSVLIRRVNVSNTQVHPLTTTGIGAGLVITSATGGLPLTRIEDSVFSNNSLTDNIASRAVIFASVPLTILRSQMLDNRGIAISANNNVELVDSTIARTIGSAMSIGSGSILRSTISGTTLTAISSRGTVSIDQSTLTQNALNSSATAPLLVVQNTAALTLRNSIIAGNGTSSIAFSNAAGAQSSGFNFLSGTRVGWSGLASDIVGDVNNPIDPMLAALANNGGPTLTHMPLAGSPVLETGSPSLIGSRDQRGVSIPQSLSGATGVLPDIGAVEASPIITAPLIQVNATTVLGNEGSQLSLRGRVSDLDANFSSLTASIGSIQTNADGTFTWKLDTTDNFNLPVTLTATDAVGQVGTLVFNAVSNNVAPQLSVTPLVDTANRRISLQSIASDPGTADTFTFVVQWGDGTTETFANTTSSQVFSRTYATTLPTSIVVTVTDDDGASSAPVTLSINSAPIIQLNATGVTGDEGSQLQLTGRVTDPQGNLAGITASIGAIQLNADGTFTWSLTPTDNLTTTVTLTATDLLGATSSATFTAIATNVAPSISNAQATYSFIGDRVSLTFSYSDPGSSDTHTLNIDWGDGSSESLPATPSNYNVSLVHQYAGVMPTTISVRVSDDDGASSATLAVPINYPPVIELAATSVTGAEGSQLSLAGRVTDRNGNLASLTASLGSVQLNSDGTFVWTFTSPDDLGTTTVRLLATDASGATGAAEFTVQVSNVVPTLASPVLSVDSSNRSVNFQALVVDPGTADTHVITIQWGDGTTSSITPTNRLLAAAHSYAADVGAISIVVSVTDDDGQSSAYSYVANSAPTLTLNASAASGNEGSTLTLTGRVSDLENNVTSLTSSLGSVQVSSDGTFTWSYAAINELSPQQVVLTARDAFGALAQSSFSIAVANVAPTLSAVATSVNLATAVLTLSATVIDPGVLDTEQVMIQWGDGTSSIVTAAAGGRIMATHAYTSAGPKVISVRATDNAGASSAAVTVEQTIHGFVILNRELKIYGTAFVDTITFLPQRRNDVLVEANFGGAIWRYTFDSKSIDTVVGYLGAGDDVWSGAELEDAQVVFGEAGNDRITTGELNDILVGGDGDDYLSGEGGADLIFGGRGADTLLGKDGGDILVAGRYQRESELSSLLLLRSAWLASGSYTTRVNRIRSGVGFDAQGAVISLSISQITDDAIDQLFGGNRSDWYLTNTASEVRGLTTDERIN